MYRFPRTRFVDVNGLVGQLYHIADEVKESWDAVQQPDIDHFTEEILDVLHSAETLLRILQEKHGVNITEATHRVEQKNRTRGYYADH